MESGGRGPWRARNIATRTVFAAGPACALDVRDVRRPAHCIHRKWKPRRRIYARSHSFTAAIHSRAGVPEPFLGAPLGKGEACDAKRAGPLGPAPRLEVAGKVVRSL